MSPPRSLRAQQHAIEAPPGEVMDAMRAYSEAHQVQQMLHIMMARLLEAQPLDPFEFLIKVAREDPELDELEIKTKTNRFDLRRESTKKTLVVGFYKRLMALQRTQHDDKQMRQSVELSTVFLLSQLRLEETREHLRTHFPKHYRDLIQWFFAHEKDLKPTMPQDAFTKICMGVLATMALAGA